MQHHRAGKYNGPPAASLWGQAGTGCHEGGIILSKKPPEWRLSRRVNDLRPILIFLAAKENGPPAALSLSQGKIARLQLSRGRKEEWPAFRMTVAGAGGNRMPRRRHNPK